MGECFGKYFIHNGVLKSAEQFDSSLVYEGESLYEIIRVIRGLPVFFSDHVERLQASVTLQGKIMYADMNLLRSNIKILLTAEKKEEVNLKVVFNYNGMNEKYLVYYIEPVYPTQWQYLHGVKGILYTAERKDPEIKIIDNRLRSAITHKLIIEKGYEALLVGSDGRITEGSRSNIFFITGNRLFTAPDNSVLGGITRKHLIEICRNNGISLEYLCVRADDISDYESVIMTGTSPVVLPFSSIDDILFSVSNPLIAHLRNLYLLRAEESMKHFSGNR